MAQTLDTRPPAERVMLTLLTNHGWHSHYMGMLDWEQYRERFVWLHENLEKPMADDEDTDLHWMYRWKAIPVKNTAGLISDVLIAFRQPADQTMFALRWA